MARRTNSLRSFYTEAVLLFHQTHVGCRLTKRMARTGTVAIYSPSAPVSHVNVVNDDFVARPIVLLDRFITLCRWYESN